MYCESTPLSVSRRLLQLAAVLTIGLAAGAVTSACGKKMKPIPPPRLVPAPVRDVVVGQRGDEILLQFSYPVMTPTGHALPPISEVEIWRAHRDVPTLVFAAETAPPTLDEDEDEAPTNDGESIAKALNEESIDPEEPVDFNQQHIGAVGVNSDIAAAESEDAPPVAAIPVPAAAVPTQSKESLIRMTAQELVDDGEVVMELEEASLDAAIHGSTIRVRMPLPPAPPRTPQFDKETGEPIPPPEGAWVFGVTTSTSRRLRSQFSNMPVLIPQTPPLAPSNLAVAPGRTGVELNWTENDPAPAVGYRVYRRESTIKDYGPALSSVAAGITRFVDPTALYGTSYIYTVTAASHDRPLIESAPAAEFEIDYQDRFPPAPPSDLVVLPDSGRVRLLWQASPSLGALRYRVYRRDAGADFAPISEAPTVRLEQEDRSVVAGRRYGYRVTAVDSAGNESDPTPEVEVSTPR